MRVHERTVIPTGLIPDINVANCRHGVFDLAVDLIAIDAERGGELVVLPDLLKLCKRGRDDLGVDNTDVGGRCGIIAQRPRLSVGDCVVAFRLDLVDAVRDTRGIDVALNVLRLEALLVGLYLELLHAPRVTNAKHNARHEEQRGTHDRQTPLARERRHEEQHCNNDRDAREDLLARDDRVHILEHGTRAQAFTARERPVLVEPQAHGLQQEVQPGENRGLDPGRLRDAHVAPRE